MKTSKEIVQYLQNRIEELSNEVKECEEAGRDWSALSSECTKQDLEELLDFILKE